MPGKTINNDGDRNYCMLAMSRTNVSVIFFYSNLNFYIVLIKICLLEKMMTLIVIIWCYCE